jgi:predicted ribosome quality control (RQC) complex YloA/Tae2 family protein
MNFLNENFNANRNSSGMEQERESIFSLCQHTIAESRLQRYQLEQSQREIQLLRDKVQSLELHKATQLGQDKIIGFLVGAIVLSLLSLATTFFFKFPQSNLPALDDSQSVSLNHSLIDSSEVEV